MKRPNRRKKGLSIPFGYTQSPENELILIPNDEVLDCLDEGIEFLSKNCSLRDVAAWVSERTGIYISHVALHYIVNKRKKEVRVESGKKSYRTRFDGIEGHSNPETEQGQGTD